MNEWFAPYPVESPFADSFSVETIVSRARKWMYSEPDAASLMRVMNELMDDERASRLYRSSAFPEERYSFRDRSRMSMAQNARAEVLIRLFVSSQLSEADRVAVLSGKDPGIDYPSELVYDPLFPSAAAREWMLSTVGQPDVPRQVSDGQARMAAALMNHAHLLADVSEEDWRYLLRSEVTMLFCRAVAGLGDNLSDEDILVALQHREAGTCVHNVITVRKGELSAEQWELLLSAGVEAPGDVARCAWTPSDVLYRLAFHPDGFVRWLVLMHPNATEEARVVAALAAD